MKDAALNLSYDLGSSYETVPMPTNIPLVNAFSPDSLLYIHCHDNAQIHELYYTEDPKKSWQLLPVAGIEDELPFEVEQMMYLKGEFWLQTKSSQNWVNEHHIYIFDEEKQVWRQVTSNLPYKNSNQHIYEFQDGIYCAIDKCPVYKYDPVEKTWIPFADDSKNVYRFHAYQNTLYCATEQGVCSLDSSGQWTTYYTGMDHRSISSIAEYDGKVFVTANDELFYSTNGGDDFERMDSLTGKKIITTDSVFYLISDYEFSLSRDEGQTWESHSTGFEIDPQIAIQDFAISPDYYYFTSSNGLFRSPVDSLNWQMPELMDVPLWEVVAIETSVYVTGGLFSGGIYSSFDNGNTFEKNAIYSIGATIGVNGAFYILMDDIYVSYDLGFNWDTISTNEPVLPLCLDRNEMVLVFSGVNQLEISYDNGASWLDITDNLPNSIIPFYKLVKIVDNKLFVASNNEGLYYRSDLGLVGMGKNNISQKRVNVFPNPASVNCTFSFYLDNPAEVTIRILDQTGKLIDVIRKNQPAGKQRIQRKIAHLTPGIYFYEYR